MSKILFVLCCLINVLSNSPTEQNKQQQESPKNSFISRQKNTTGKSCRLVRRDSIVVYLCEDDDQYSLTNHSF